MAQSPWEQLLERVRKTQPMTDEHRREHAQWFVDEMIREGHNPRTEDPEDIVINIAILSANQAVQDELSKTKH